MKQHLVEQVREILDKEGIQHTVTRNFTGNYLFLVQVNDHHIELNTLAQAKLFVLGYRFGKGK